MNPTLEGPSPHQPRRARPCSLFPALLCVSGLAIAQTATPPASPPAPALSDDQLANITKQLDAIETQINKGRGDLLGAALAKFRAAMAGQKEALTLYVDSYKLNHFDRKDLKQSEFQEWKDRNEARLKDEEFLVGLKLQLEFLMLSIQAQEVRDQKEMGPVVSALQAFLPKVVTAVQSSMKHTASGAVEAKDRDDRARTNGGRPGANRPGWPDARPGGGGGRGEGGGPGENRRATGFDGGGQLGAMLRESVKSTEFSKAFQLDDHLQRKDWEYAPLEIAGIYELVIFPYYRTQKPSELGAQWDARINAELALAKSSQSESEYATFFKERQPELQWEKNVYLVDNKINPVLALADMLKIVRDHPNHPQAATWLKKLRDSVSATRTGAPTPSASQAPLRRQSEGGG
jgi:hypothetical protein